MNTRTQRTIAFNRRNILDAADKLFCKNGVEKTTMEQLRQRLVIASLLYTAISKIKTRFILRSFWNLWKR